MNRKKSSRRTGPLFDADGRLKTRPEAEALTPAEIKAVRRRLGISQAELARYLDVQTVCIAHWEQGIRRCAGPARLAVLFIERELIKQEERDLR